MKIRLYNLTLNALITILFVCVFSFQGVAETVENSDKSIKKNIVTIIPLNITAGKNDRNAIRSSVGRFLLHRLNGQEYTAKKAEKLVGITSDDLNKIYTSLNSKKVDDRIKGGKGNQYVCGGNVVVLGSSVMADFFLYSIETGEKKVEHNASGADIGKVLTAAEEFTVKVKALFALNSGGNLEDSTNPVVSVGQKNTQRTNQHELSDKILIKGDKVEGEITSVVFSKFDSTGKSYAVYSLSDKIIAMEIIDGKFVFKSEFTNKKHDKIIGLASIDTDQDGIEELVVSNIKSDNRTISSYVLKWKDKNFIEVLSNINWIFSRSGSNSSENFLYAQKHNTLKTTLDSGVFKVTFEKGQLVVPDKMLNLPKWVLLPGVSINPISDLMYGAAFRSDNRLRAFTEKGEIFWESSDPFGGGNTYLLEKNNNERDFNNRVWLHSPVVISDVYSGNKYPEIITVDNIDSTRKLFSRVRSFDGGRLKIYSINELSCSPFSQTDKVSGYISGFDIDIVMSKIDSLLFYSVVQKGKNIFADNKSFIVIQNVNSLKKLNSDG